MAFDTPSFESFTWAVRAALFPMRRRKLFSDVLSLFFFIFYRTLLSPPLPPVGPFG